MTTAEPSASKAKVFVSKVISLQSKILQLIISLNLSFRKYINVCIFFFSLHLHFGVYIKDIGVYIKDISVYIKDISIVCQSVCVSHGQDHQVGK